MGQVALCLFTEIGLIIFFSGAILLRYYKKNNVPYLFSFYVIFHFLKEWVET
jgi:hypothetical protein